MKIERGDAPGVWHHVTNRGIARRPVFENRKDVRFFLSRLARCVRKGLVEVHAYCVLTTHFHLLLRSPEGELGRSMKLIQNAYARWFNRSRLRDGPLFRGRFRSRPVDSEEYWFAVVRYIDRNPVEARLVQQARSYPYGSAFHYARAARPIWLSRSVVEEAAMGGACEVRYEPSRYARVFGDSASTGQNEVVERRIGGLGRSAYGEDFVGSSPSAVRRWFERKAHLADGTLPGRFGMSAARVRELIRRGVEQDPGWRVQPRRVSRPGWPILEAGMLREACGLRYREIAEIQGCSRSAAQERASVHAQLVACDSNYARRVEEYGAR